MNMAERLKSIRSTLSLTQGALAEKIGASRSTIANYERGGAIPSADFCSLLVIHLNVNGDYLLTGKGEMFTTDDQPSFEDLIRRILPGVNLDEDMIAMIKDLHIPVVRHGLVIAHLRILDDPANKDIIERYRSGEDESEKRSVLNV